MFISDSITTEKYENWKEGDYIFISAPTGSGKTTFILKTLLPYLASQGEGKQILYLVNRTVLKKQIEVEVSKLPFEQRRLIRVELYQYIEKIFGSLRHEKFMPDYWAGYFEAIKKFIPAEKQEFYLKDSNQYYQYDYLLNGANGLLDLMYYDYIVCDEAHYFLMDSNYNTNTYLSYRFVRDILHSKIRIFMSATIEPIKEYIYNDYKLGGNCRTEYFAFPTTGTRFGTLPKYWDYSSDIERNYDYIDIHILNRRNELAKIIAGSDRKWLIFVDSKDFGISLKNDILENCVEDEEGNKPYVSFVTSDYEKDYETLGLMAELVNDCKHTAKVLIATSVLDNGINIKDIELRDIAIFTDTETELIQMLGRRRQDGNRLQLYLFKYDENHFFRRQRINSTRLAHASQNYNQVMREVDAANDKLKNMTEINLVERNVIFQQHKFLLQKVMNYSIRFEDLKTLYMSLGGILYLNPLSFANLEMLNQFYWQILEEFKEYGEDAFVRRQMLWLNKTEDEIQSIILYEKEGQYERSRRRIIDEFTKIQGKLFTLDENRNFQSMIKDDLLELVEYVGPKHPDYKKFRNLAYKNKREMSVKFIDFLWENCGIPFCMEINDGIRIIKERTE